MTAVEAARLDEAFTVAGTPLKIEHGEHSSTNDTGLAVWDGALILSKFLELQLTTTLSGATVLDLGAGCGVTSIAAAALGAYVNATDLPYCLPLLQRNVDSNAELLAAHGGSVAVSSLDWLHAAESGDKVPDEVADADVVLAADVIWDTELVEPLLRTVERALQQMQSGVVVSDTSSACGGHKSNAGVVLPYTPASCCCCELHAAQDLPVGAAAQLACDMGLDDLCEAPDRGNVCAEDVWLAGQRRRGVPVCYLAYTFRLDSVDAALQCGLRGINCSDGSKTGSRRFCVSEVPAHRVPWQSLGGERDFSDESSPPVRIFRVQLACNTS